MLQNARVAAFTISELLRENQQEWGGGVGLKKGFLRCIFWGSDFERKNFESILINTIGIR